jgi:hypothetical protein
LVLVRLIKLASKTGGFDLCQPQKEIHFILPQENVSSTEGILDGTELSNAAKMSLKMTDRTEKLGELPH